MVSDELINLTLWVWRSKGWCQQLTFWGVQPSQIEKLKSDYDELVEVAEDGRECHWRTTNAANPILWMTLPNDEAPEGWSPW